MNSHEIGVIACARCGECCKKEPGCLYGEDLPCKHLVKQDGLYACAEMLNAKDPEMVKYDLGIGEGCCQPTLRFRKALEDSERGEEDERK